MSALNARDPAVPVGALGSYRVTREPYYRPHGDELELFHAAHARRMPVLLKGPTGCGKTRFVEHMAWSLGQALVTVACHEDMSASDLVGRYLLEDNRTRWQDGPLTLAARHGALCYLDELVEARQDTTVVIHPLADQRRILPLEKKGEILHAHEDFHLVVSYNPGYQALVKDLKPSTRQRFVALEFGYPVAAVEAEIVERESGIELGVARQLADIAERSRALKGHGLDEGISTRMLVQAARLMADGVPAHAACRVALVAAASDDGDVCGALQGLVDAHFA